MTPLSILPATPQLPIAIIGSRDGVTEVQVQAAYLLVAWLRPYLNGIVSGGARGADKVAAARQRRGSVAERIAGYFGLRMTVHHPDYDRFGKRAPLERNRRIIVDSAFVVALWDGVSRGTAHALGVARALSRPAVIISPDGSVASVADVNGLNL